ncbi:hypothetical protein [Inquilinus sp.]|uniref:hypothetical protein n=1 Tax=Inquilinus sp. TaxID=1932117 RepID=UPI0031DA57FC
MTPILVLWATYVANALLWAGGAVAVLGAIILVLGLCRAVAQPDGAVAVDLEIDQ